MPGLPAPAALTGAAAAAALRGEDGRPPSSLVLAGKEDIGRHLLTSSPFRLRFFLLPRRRRQRDRGRPAAAAALSPLESESVIQTSASAIAARSVSRWAHPPPARGRRAVPRPRAQRRHRERRATAALALCCCDECAAGLVTSPQRPRLLTNRPKSEVPVCFAGKSH